MVFAYPRPGPDFSGGGIFSWKWNPLKASTFPQKNPTQVTIHKLFVFFILAENVDFIDGFSKFRNLRFLNNFDANCQVFHLSVKLGWDVR